MPSLEGNAPDDRAATQCMCSWRTGVPCPNEYTHVIETLHQPGFSRMCGTHYTGYMGAFGRGTAHDIRVWERAAWEAAGREAELRALIPGWGT